MNAVAAKPSSIFLMLLLLFGFSLGAESAWLAEESLYE
jgi:hypothetical protein